MAKTIDDLVKAAGRELGMRRNAYPRMVRENKLTQAEADHQLACQEETFALLKREQAKLREREKNQFDPGCLHCWTAEAMDELARTWERDHDGETIGGTPEGIGKAYGMVMRAWAKAMASSPEEVLAMHTEAIMAFCAALGTVSDLQIDKGELVPPGSPLH